MCLQLLFGLVTVTGPQAKVHPRKMAILEYFLMGAKNMGKTANFISLYGKHQDNTLFIFYYHRYTEQ